MLDLAHPPWCIPTACNADRPPVFGHHIGLHRSSPEAVGATVLRLAQSPEVASPSVEVRRGDDVLFLPLLEAQALAPAIGDLLQRAGVRP